MNNSFEGTTASELDKVGVKYDTGKDRWDLLPVKPIEAVVRILTFGCIKYNDRNWEKGFVWGRVFAATMRHLWKWWGGESLDPETGESHLAHAATNIFFLLEFEARGIGTDDRPHKENTDGNL